MKTKRLNKKTLAGKKPHERTEDEWDAFHNADLLARAEIIKADPDLLFNAQLAASILVDREKSETEAMEIIANG